MKFTARYIAGRVVSAAVIALVFVACNKAFGQDTQPDYTQITNFAEWHNVVVGVLSIGVAICGVLVAMAGVRVLLDMISGSDYVDGGDGYMYDANDPDNYEDTADYLGRDD